MEGLDGAREEEGFVLRTARIVIETSSSHSSSIGDRGTGCTADGVTSSLRASGAEVATYTSHLNAAARRGDWDEAETLWLELLDEGLQPDVHTLNALLRCVMRAGVYDVDAEALVRDVCGDGTVHPNCFTHQLLSSIMLQGEQLVRGG
jgi:pentatricopeptide repeat protein